MSKEPAAARVSDREANELMTIAYEQAMEDARHSVSPCIVNCGEPACEKLGCVRVYNAEHRESAPLSAWDKMFALLRGEIRV